VVILRIHTSIKAFVVAHDPSEPQQSPARGDPEQHRRQNQESDREARCMPDRTINTRENAGGLKVYTAGKGYSDVLIECSGAAPALTGGIATLRSRGRIVQLGLGGEMTLPMTAITAKELDLLGSFRFHEEFPVAVTMMRNGQIAAKPLISATYGLEDAREAFEAAGDRGRTLKAQIAFALPA